VHHVSQQGINAQNLGDPALTLPTGPTLAPPLSLNGLNVFQDEIVPSYLTLNQEPHLTDNARLFDDTSGTAMSDVLENATWASTGDFFAPNVIPTNVVGANTIASTNSSVHGMEHLYQAANTGSLDFEMFTPPQDSVYSEPPAFQPLPELPPSPAYQWMADPNNLMVTDDGFAQLQQACKIGDAGVPSCYLPVQADAYQQQQPLPQITAQDAALGTLPPVPPNASRSRLTDLQLVQLRAQGLSYKQIKDKLNLSEAESTLRGRHRSLTKPKEARLRKPEWSQDSASLFPDLIHFHALTISSI
jgi:hypothetical protein